MDAGDGRRLERFGEILVDRPAPMAEDAPLDPSGWAEADLRFDKYLGWSGHAARDGGPHPWLVCEGDLSFELRATETGQVGLFPEQAANRAWVRDAVGGLDGPVEVLNLFAYTGAMTVAAAAAGAAVAHVDGSRPTVAWARRNAELSGLADGPVRWIVDDAEGFAAREQRRGRQYDAVILDPPSYGHGRRAGGALASRGTSRRPPGTMCGVWPGTTPRSSFSPLTRRDSGLIGWRSRWRRAFRRSQRDVDAGELGIRARSGARLRLGAYARIIREMTSPQNAITSLGQSAGESCRPPS